MVSRQSAILDRREMLLARRMADYMDIGRLAGAVSLVSIGLSILVFASLFHPVLTVAVAGPLACVNIARYVHATIYFQETYDIGYIRRHARLAGYLSYASSVLWGIGFAALWLAADPQQHLFLIVLATGICATSLMQYYSMPRSAVALIVSAMGAAGFSALFQPIAYSIPTLALTALFGLSLLASVRAAVRVYERKLEKALELEKKSDLVSLLLREYETASADWLWETDAGGCLANVCDRFAAAHATPAAVLDGRELVGLFRPGPDRERLAGHLLRRTHFRDLTLELDGAGEPRWWLISGHPQGDGVMRGVLSDVTRTREDERRIARLARQDTLTGLANRFTFNETLADLVARPAKNQKMALLYIDLDHFKAVNDSHGHAAGDLLLTTAARRIAACVRDHDLVARLGGDEFAVLLPRMADPESVRGHAQAIVDSLARPYLLPEGTVRLSASVGIAYCGGGRLAPDEMMHRADLALYEAKAMGRSCYREFRHELTWSARDRRTLELDLKTAVADGQIALVFQPQVALESGRRIGMEALARWHHPTRGLVMPGEFIHIAEETGAIVQLGEWIMREALHQAAGWDRPLQVAINLSPVQLRDPGFVGMMADALAASGIDPARVGLEITETALLHESEANVRALHRLRALGIRIELDDFGTGYSSLNYLRSFPFDTIKIDRCFVADVTERADCQAIIRATLALARDLGMETIAEGIESVEQYRWLTAHGCDAGQGHFISEPLGPNDGTAEDGPGSMGGPPALPARGRAGATGAPEGGGMWQAPFPPPPTTRPGAVPLRG